MAGLQKRYPVEKLQPDQPDAGPGVGVPLESMAQEPRRRGPYQVVARFGAPVREEWLADLEDAGYTIQGPIGQSAVVVEASNKVTLAKLAQFPHVQQVDPHVPVVALSQLSRAPEQRTDRRPQLADLRESGSIEQDADLVMFLYRPEYYLGPVDKDGNSLEGKSELAIAKQRNGPTGSVDLFFHKAYTRFDSVTPREFEGGGAVPAQDDPF